MRHTLVLIAALAVSASLSAIAVSAPALDAAGKCRDNGKFVTAAQCKTAPAATKCRDAKTKKFAKCSAPGTEPVPVQTKK